MENRARKVVTVRMHELYNTGLAKPKAKPEAKPKAKVEAKLKAKTDASPEAKPEAMPEAKRNVRSLVMELIFSVLLLAAICALRTVQVFANNVGKATFSDLGQSMWVYMGISVAAFAILRIFLRKPYFACTFVAFGTFIAINFIWLVDLFRLFFNSHNPAVIGGLVLYVVLVVGFFFLLRLFYKKKFPIHTIARILSITFTCLVLFNVVLAFIATGKAAPSNTQEAEVPPVVQATPVKVTPAPTVQATGGAAAPVPTTEVFGQPNVYFFILDEYGTFDIMSKYYGYDNAVFYDFLNIKGFNISRESYGTDNQTSHCFADLLNLDYISRKLSNSKCMESISNAPLFTTFSDLGYSQFQISNSKYFKGIDSLSSGTGGGGYEDANMFGDEEAGDVSDDSLSDALFELLQPTDSETEVDTEALNQWGFYPSDYIRDSKEYKQHKLNGYADSLLKKLDYFKDPSHYDGTTPRVNYVYMTATHVPFIFNEYGGIIPYGQNRNWEDTDVYLNQYKFINKQLMATLSTIIENDPDSVIIIMSDHGIRYHADCNKKHTFYINDKDSCRIMNAVYIKGQEYDIEGLSGVNTLRYILSLYEGQDYPPIEGPITSDSPDSLRGIIPKPR